MYRQKINIIMAVMVAFIMLPLSSNTFGQVYSNAVTTGAASGNNLSGGRGSSTLGVFRAYSTGTPDMSIQKARRSRMLGSSMRYSGTGPRSAYNSSRRTNYGSSISNVLQRRTVNNAMPRQNTAYMANQKYTALNQNIGRNTSAYGQSQRQATPSIIKPLKPQRPPRTNKFDPLASLPDKYKSKVSDKLKSTIETGSSIRKKLLRMPTSKLKRNKYSK
ncbi:MAG: hypothetical protein JEZ07_15430 [Phycisphaerae bacterium]|nr:hypothetical protein [Phycisphaerae bacterium]